MTLPHVVAGQPHVAAHNAERDMINANNLAITFRAAKSANLSDLDDASEARDNLGLGTAATHDTGYFVQQQALGFVSAADPQWAGGVDATGATDSTAAINALQAALNVQSLLVAFPEGLIKSSVALKPKHPGTHIRGAAFFATTLQLTGTDRGVFVEDVPNCIVSDLTIDGNKGSTTDSADLTKQQPIYIHASNSTGCPGTRIQNVFVINSHQRGISCVADTLTTNPLEVDIINCVSNDNGVNDTGAGQNGIRVEKATRCRINSSDVRRNGGYGIHVTGCLSASVLDCEATDQHNNHGIVVNGGTHDITITGNRCYRNLAISGTGQTKWGIVVGLDAASLIVSGNICDANDGGITIDVAEVDPSVFVQVKGVVTGNACLNSIRSNGLNVNHVDGLLITGNTSTANAQDGISITGRNCNVTGNHSYRNGRRGVAFLESGDGCGPHRYDCGSNYSWGNNTVAGSWVDLYTDTLTNGAVKFAGLSGVVASVESDTTVANTVTETTVATLNTPTTPIPPQVGERYIFRVEGKAFNNSAGAVTFQFKLKIATTQIVITNALSLSASASARPFYLEAVIVISGSTAQVVGGYMTGFQSGSGGLTLGTAGGYGAIEGSSAIDLSTATAVKLNVIMGTADVNAQTIVHACSLERLSKAA